LNEELDRRLLEMKQQSLEGKLGEVIQAAAKEYQHIPPSPTLLIRFVNDFYQPHESEEDAEIAGIAEMFCKILIVIYRDAKKRNAEVAHALLFSFLQDFPGADNTCLFSRWDYLAKAALGFQAASETNAILAWEQAKNLFQAYNEFLNGLLGYMLIAWRCALEKPFAVNTLTNPYASKLNEFADLTGGEDSPFGLILKLARPDIRNAIAHGSIWLVSDSKKVRFSDRHQTHELDLTDFLMYGLVGSHLAQSYLVAIAVLVLCEIGTSAEASQIPTHLSDVFYHSTS
jgi:hypothetical protein